MPLPFARRSGAAAPLPLYVPLAGIACSLLPLAIMAACRIGAARSGRVFMGEIQYDQFYYLASARAVHERGNGFAYPNPYDDDPASPLLYTHLYPLLAGWIFRLTPLSILQVDYLIRILGGIAFAISLWRLVTVFFEDPRERRGVFWVVLLAGGCVWVEALRRLLARGEWDSWYGVWTTYFGADVAGGWWFQNVLRNFFYSTETLYHALAFRLLYALAAGKGAQAFLSLALVLYAHPMTGLQFGAITAAWVVAERMSGRPGLRGLALAGSLAALGAFLVYYFVWLPRFPAYVEIVERWRRAGHYSDPLPYLRVYGPWLILLTPALWATRGTWLRAGPWRLLAIGLAVSVVLMNNHWFLGKERPVQPLHFSHGYEFLPMALLVLAWVLRWERIRSWLRRAGRLVLLVAILALDNLAFLPVVYHNGLALTLTRSEAQVLERVSQLPPPQTILARPTLLSYLFPTFSPHRVVFGHGALTPGGDGRLSRLGSAFLSPGMLFASLPRVTLLVATDVESLVLEHLGHVGPDELLFEVPGVRVYRRPAR